MEGGAALTYTYAAVPESVSRVRRDVTTLARAAGAGDAALEAIRLATSEAVTNVVRHAYAGEPGQVHVSAGVSDGELWLLVADDGCGMDCGERDPGLGMGLHLIAHVADHFDVAGRPGGGTTVQMRFELEIERRSWADGSGELLSVLAL